MSEQRMYRGKTEDGKWVYGWYVEVGRPYILPEGKALNTDFVEVIPSSVGQSTGWKDVRGTESYHHDIVKSKHYGRGEIVWAGQGWGVADEAGTFYSLSYEFTIIGTIHDKPELLQEADGSQKQKK